MRQLVLGAALAAVGCTNTALEGASDVVDVGKKAEALFDPIPFFLWHEGGGTSEQTFGGLLRVDLYNRYEDDTGFGQAAITNLSGGQMRVVATFTLDCDADEPDQIIPLDWIIEAGTTTSNNWSCHRFNWSAIDGNYRF